MSISVNHTEDTKKSVHYYSFDNYGTWHCSVTLHGKIIEMPVMISEMFARTATGCCHYPILSAP
jgi:hypothetical protein